MVHHGIGGSVIWGQKNSVVEVVRVVTTEEDGVTSANHQSSSVEVVPFHTRGPDDGVSVVRSGHPVRVSGMLPFMEVVTTGDADHIVSVSVRVPTVMIVTIVTALVRYTVYRNGMVEVVVFVVTVVLGCGTESGTPVVVEKVELDWWVLESDDVSYVVVDVPLL